MRNRIKLDSQFSQKETFFYTLNNTTSFYFILQFLKKCNTSESNSGPFFLSTPNGNKWFKEQQGLGAVIYSTVSIAMAIHAPLLL